MSAAAPLSTRTFAVELLDAAAGPARVSVYVPRTADGREPARPSLLLPTQPRLVPLESPRPGPNPSFTDDGSHVRVRLAFERGTSFYGTGEVAGPLERTGKAVTFWNTDSFEYDETNSQLYQSHPYVLALLPDGRALGWLADSIRRGRLAFEEAEAEGPALELAFESEPFDLYRIEGSHPAEVTRALAALVGRMAMPPLWALGYHQCRWSYASAEEVRALAAEFRRRGIPCDGLWLDIDYMDGFRVFTTDPEAFPDLAALTAELRAQGFRTVAILDPGVAIDSELAREGLAQDLFVKAEDGTPAVGKVWPGACHFPDFTSAAARAWWRGHVRAFVTRTGLDGLWNDMNEPAVMDGPGKTLPDACYHAGTDGSGGSHARWHNLYGQLMVQASREGFVEACPERRPFLLTRASHVSGARLAATWTGDNSATWDHLRWSITMALNLGLSGQPFSGPDVGGFSDDPDSELFTRWFELGALLPFFRGHAEKTTRRKEPWAFDAETEARVRLAIERRMRLLPTLYTLFREAHELGLPVVRPLCFADPADPALRTVGDAFLLGDDLLVAPVVEPGARERRVLLPRVAGGWFPFPGGGVAPMEREALVPAPLGTLPLFARAGAILFEHEPRPSTATPARLLVVHAFCDADGRAEGRLYEDEGEGHAHARGAFRETRFRVQAREGELEVLEEERGGLATSAPARFLVIHAGGRVVRAVRARAAIHRLPG